MSTVELLVVGWPVVTALASVAGNVIGAKFPRFAAFLRAAGLDLPGVVAALRPTGAKGPGTTPRK